MEMERLQKGKIQPSYSMRRAPVIIDYLEQGSPEWFNARLGRITMSNAQKLLTGGAGETRRSYLLDVASEIITGVPSEKISTQDMLRGNALEPFARQAYEVMTGSKVDQVGLAYLNKQERISASPDGLVNKDGHKKGIEIKCQAPKNHLKTIIASKHPKQFTAQMQGSMWVFDVDSWDYCSFCPEFEDIPLVIITQHRDEKLIKEIEEESLKALEEIELYVQHASFNNPSPLLAPILSEALEIVDLISNKEPEIE